MSGPLLDRIDIHVFVKDVDPREIISPQQNRVDTNNSNNETEAIQSLVFKARERQQQRFSSGINTTNGDMNARSVQHHCTLTPELAIMLEDAANSFGLSARAIHKTLKVARTIADLDDSDTLEENHISEALNYRRKTTT